MAYTKSKYTKNQNSEITFSVLDVLLEKAVAMNIDEIKSSRVNLAGLTTQKLARVLTDLNEKNLVRKAKNRATGRMEYKATAVMAAEGYDVSEPQSDY